MNTPPPEVVAAMKWNQQDFYGRYEKLITQSLNDANLSDWLADWSSVSDLAMEVFYRLYVATTLDTADKESSQAYHHFLEDIYPSIQEWEQQLKSKLLDSGLTPENFRVPLARMKAEAQIFREKNLKLLVEEQKLASEYERIVGAQTVEWHGDELTPHQLKTEYLKDDRALRKQAWRTEMACWQNDREAINQLWTRFMAVRGQIAANAGYDNYREYRWLQLGRLDYNAADCQTFHQAIEEVVVPAAERIYQRRQNALGLTDLRPWDLNVDISRRPPLRPFTEENELIVTTGKIFNRINPELAEYFRIMQTEGCLDLASRKGKGPGGYCEFFPVSRRPFIFMNAVGIHDDAQTLLHEAGHAFHGFEAANLPYSQQKDYPMEFAEVASMAMELLASPNLAADQGGFYSPDDAARAQIEHLESDILFWPYMAVVDSFQHWVYENPRMSADPAACDDHWSRLWDRFMPGINWQGLEEEKASGWHRKLHIHVLPFYYIEYGIAQLGAVQVWRNSLDDNQQALTDYRRALSLGATRSLPELFQTAGAKFAFKADILGEAVELMEKKIEELATLGT